MRQIPKAGLQAALFRGEPLADVVVKFRAGADPVWATEHFNSLADDFDLYPQPLYNDAHLRIGSATRGALDRMFGWKLLRTTVPGHPAMYRWEEVAPPCRYPPPFEELIESIHLSQPGADDDGQWYEYTDPGWT